MTEGNHTGYRFWRVENGNLVSPFAGTILPTTGTLTNQCRTHTTTPALGCCGVSYYPNPQDIRRVAQLLNPDTMALTIGTVTGPTHPDNEPPTYHYGLESFTLPIGRRCNTYTPTRITTNAYITGYTITTTRWL